MSLAIQSLMKQKTGFLLYECRRLREMRGDPWLMSSSLAISIQLKEVQKVLCSRRAFIRSNPTAVFKE